MRSLWSAIKAHCPGCDEKRIWRSFGEMFDTCPKCAYRFEREEGYWVGAMIVAIAIVMLFFVILFVGGMLLTWPDVPWNALLVINLVVIGLSPIVLYPQSKTLWVWIDITFMTAKENRPSISR